MGCGSVVRSLEGIRSLLFFTSDTVNTLGLNWCFLFIIAIIRFTFNYSSHEASLKSQLHHARVLVCLIEHKGFKDSNRLSDVSSQVWVFEQPPDASSSAAEW